MKILSLLMILFSGYGMVAQNTFKGSIQYKIVSFSEKEQLESNKMDLHFGVGKYLAYFPESRNNEEGEEKKEQKVLVNTNTNRAYILNDKEKTYTIEAQKETPPWKLNKLDSSKTYFQKNADCYLLQENEYLKVYGWFTNDMNMDCGAQPCITGDAPFMVAGKIPLIIEMYNSGKKLLGIYATDIVTANAADTALFSLANYTLADEEKTMLDTGIAVPKAPMDTIMEESEIKVPSVITDKEIQSMEAALKKMSITEKKQFLEEIEKSFDLMKGMGNEDKLKIKKFIEKLKKSIKEIEKPAVSTNKEN